MKKDTERTGYGFGTFQGVFTPSILTIIGVVVYLRFGWMLGNIGLMASLATVTIGSAITFLTGLSISALATNMRVKGGGAYFMLSRSLGLEAGGAIGIPLAISQTVAVSFYITGFAEALVDSGLPVVSGWDPRIIGVSTLVILAVVATLSANIALKTQYFIMAAIFLSFVSFFAGGAPEVADTATNVSASVPKPVGFWPVFAVFFPAVTGILSGVGMSGDLRDPGKSIPRGTIAAVVVGYLVYMAVPIVLNSFVPDVTTLRTDTMILYRCARWPSLILLGVWAATLSSAVGSFLIAPRAVQALARDRLLPEFLGRGFGVADNPLIAAIPCVIIAGAGVWLGDINALAPVLTLFNLSTYALLNFCAGVEELMSNPSWRPTFKCSSFFSLVGFAACVVAMFMISPGWTFVALSCEAFIYWLIKRRALRTHWGDMRTGIYVALVRFAFRKLGRSRNGERNWRPNILTFVPLSGVRRQLFGLVRDISDGRSLVTVASVIPERFGGPDKTTALADSLRRTVGQNDLEAAVKLLQADSPWTGMAELLRNYGYGPVVPNTVVIGEPHPHSTDSIGEFVSMIHGLRRNLLVVGDREESTETNENLHYIDLWWRGGGTNGGLMLAIACLLQRSDLWRKRRLRVNMIVHRRTVEEAKAMLDDYLRDVRVKAETRVMESGGQSFAEVINENSADAALTFVGLRLPSEGEPPSAFGEYILGLAENLRSVPQPAYVVAAEDIDFRRIFT